MPRNDSTNGAPLKRSQGRTNLKVFVSWSGLLSKNLANHLQEFLRQVLGQKIKIFYSPESILNGDNWFNKISKELKEADVCIIVLTKDNLQSQWLNFEAGAIMHNRAKSKLVCPLLVNLDHLDKGNPLNVQQITRYAEADIRKLLKAIHTKFKAKLGSIPQFDALFEMHFKNLKREFEKSLSELDDHNFLDMSGQRIYPTDVIRLKRNRVFLGAPMASATHYEDVRKELLNIKKTILEYCEISDVYYPGENIETPDKFDGKEAAIAIDFRELKSSEYCVFIYPEKVASSILLEIGYAIAAMKKIIIFTKSVDILPFMLQEAGMRIANLRIYRFNEYDEIVERLKKEKQVIFSYDS